MQAIYAHSSAFLAQNSSNTITAATLLDGKN
jgi:hypothetical protein